MRVYDQERQARPHDRALRFVFEALTAVALVSCVIALSQSHVVWSLVLAAVAWGCFEAASELDDPS